MILEWAVLGSIVTAGYLAGLMLRVAGFILVVVPLTLAASCFVVVQSGVHWLVLPVGWIGQQAAYCFAVATHDPVRWKDLLRRLGGL